MSELYTLSGFVLNNRLLREADRLYTFFSREKGKVSVLARGGQKMISKLAPHLESLAYVSIFVVEGRHGLTLAGSDIIESYYRQGVQDEQLPLMMGALHLVDLGMRFDHPESEWHDDLLAWMRFLKEQEELTPARETFLMSVFGLRSVVHAGYDPELDVCLVCRLPVRPEGLFWSSAQGGVVCTTCYRQEVRPWLRARLIDPDTLKLLRVTRQASWLDIVRLRLSSRVLAEFHDLVEGLVLAHFPTIPTVPITQIAQVDFQTSSQVN